MNKSEIDQNILDRIQQLQEKYQAMGQDMTSYLDGLLYADYLKYWDYINLDSLLGLQQPKTNFPDEMIFIMYHQITELYFKMARWEMEQIHDHEHPDADFFIARVKRINNYFENLCHSFNIMIDGMEKEQFLKFRMSLLPSSGFQSAQYRLIEIGATDMINLVKLDKRAEFDQGGSVEAMYENIYWMVGATELATGNKTLTLRHFEEKYSDDFIRLGEKTRETNFAQLYNKFYQDDPKAEDLRAVLRQMDILTNVEWPLSHYKSAVRYLQKDPEDIKATGGTNWQKYLPPRFQKIIFFPDLWTEQEKQDWGKSWVKTNVFGL